MKRIQKAAAWLLCLALLAPAFALAQGDYSAGTMMETVTGDSYAYGSQITAQLTFEQEADEQASRRAQAAFSLLSKSELTLSFYDDYGTARIHGALSLDGVELFEATVLLPQDGSMQLQTNLTGNTMLTLPAGTFGKTSSFQDVFYGSLMRRKTDVSLTEMTASERLRATASDVVILVFNHLLGWTSYQQMEREETLYVFDDTVLPATETRDAVEQRMIGTVYASEFTELIWNICATIDAEMGDFQQALADVLAERGVTRLQVRRVVDALFTKETIDPAVDFVQPTHAIPDDGAPCTYNDVSYFFKKLVKCTDAMWENCTEETLSLIVSYDANGRMVGFDAVLPKFTQELPYEGGYTWSLKRDEYEQETQTMHGELQLFEGNRVIGDAVAFLGQDVEGVCERSLAGTLDLANSGKGESYGIGLSGQTTRTLTSDGLKDGEALEGAGTLKLRVNGEEKELLSATAEGQMQTENGVTFLADGNLGLEIPLMPNLRMLVDLRTGTAEETSFVGGQALDLTQMTAEDAEQLADTVKQKVMAIGPKLMLHPGVIADFTKLISD